jgi:hypothetical protein
MSCGGLLAGCLACAGLVYGLAALGSVFVAQEQDDVTAVLDAFMLAMAAGDVDRAHSLFAAQARNSRVRAGLESSSFGAAFALYDGYRTLDLSHLTVGVQSAGDPMEPNGTVARVTGFMHYSDGSVANFESTLVREQGVWMLWNVTIALSPESLDYFSKRPSCPPGRW